MANSRTAEKQIRKVGGPVLPDAQTIQTMLPNAIDPTLYAPYKANLLKILRVNDEQLALNRYRWYNLPHGLDGQMIERILYYRGTGAFFYMPEVERFAFLPYTLDGNIDIYGRYTHIKPLPFMGEDALKSESGRRTATLINSIRREPVYDLLLDPQITDEPLDSKAVLLTDYCRQLSQTILPRQKLNEGLLDLESNILPYVNTLLSNSTGVNGVRTNGDDEAALVNMASDTVNLAALNGKKWIGINAALELQELGNAAGAMRVQDMLLAMESLDNLRLGTFGIDNGGIFNKKAHLLNAEAAQQNGTSSLVMDDGLYQRQQAADLINSWFLAPMGVDPQYFVAVDINPTIAGMDMAMDGELGTGFTDNKQSAGQQITEAAADSGTED